MKQPVIKSILLTILLIAFFLSCKKEEDENSSVNLLTRSEWRLSKHEEKINSDPYVDYFPGLPSCSRDDKYSFRKDGSYEVNEGATKCDPSDPQVFLTGTWQFTQNGSKINIDANEFTINQLDQDTFFISRNFISNPDTEYYKYTFVH